MGDPNTKNHPQRRGQHLAWDTKSLVTEDACHRVYGWLSLQTPAPLFLKSPFQDASLVRGDGDDRAVTECSLPCDGQWCIGAERDSQGVADPNPDSIHDLAKLLSASYSHLL
jgi:hypothetical protein